MANKKATGKRGKTRRKLKRKGAKLTVSGYLKKPEKNARVFINIDSSVHSGIPPARFQGLSGTVKSVNADSVEVLLGERGKTVTVHPSHLSLIGGGKK